MKVYIAPVSASRRPEASVVVSARRVYFQTCPKSGLVDNSTCISPAGRWGNAARAMVFACCSEIFGAVDGVTVLKAPAMAVRIGSGISVVVAGVSTAGFAVMLVVGTVVFTGVAIGVVVAAVLVVSRVCWGVRARVVAGDGCGDPVRAPLMRTYTTTTAMTATAIIPIFFRRRRCFFFRTVSLYRAGR